MDALSNLVEGNVGATVVVFGVLWGFVMLQGQLLFWAGKRELSRIWQSEENQDKRLKQIEVEVHGEETDLSAIRTRLEDHVQKEEQVWNEIHAIGREVRDMRRQLPNGDLKAAVIKLDTLTSAFDRLATEVRAHNTEAEVWKRKIEVQDVRLKVLEK